MTMQKVNSDFELDLEIRKSFESWVKEIIERENLPIDSLIFTRLENGLFSDPRTESAYQAHKEIFMLGTIIFFLKASRNSQSPLTQGTLKTKLRTT